jgi:hypothetical protein
MLDLKQLNIERFLLSSLILAMGDQAKSVDAIVEDVVSSPQLRSLVANVIENMVNSNQPSTTSASDQQSNYNSNINKRQTFSSPVAEFNAIFRQGASSDLVQQGGGNVSSFFANTV